MALGERLRGARHRAGLSLRALAEQVGVSAQAISKYERDLDTPGSAVLIRLAKALGVSVEYLLRPTTVALSPPSYRSHISRLRRRQEQVILAQVRDWLERYLTVESILGEFRPFDAPALQRKIETPEDVEHVALEVRERWRLGLEPIPNLTEVLEAHGIKVGHVAGADAFDALTLWAVLKEPRQAGPVPVIVIKKDVPGDRQRFSLAHELGHLVLQTPDTWERRAVERAASRFAGALLTPEPSVRRELGDHRKSLDLYELHLLKHRYGMSMQAWIYRAWDLGILSQAAARRMFHLFNARGWKTEEPGDPYPPEKTDRLERMVLRALAEGLVSETRAAELLGMALEEFWQGAREEHADLPLPLRAG